jgi:hypothetical protein
VNSTQILLAGFRGAKPPFLEHLFTDVLGYTAVVCHVLDVLHLHAMGASVTGVLAAKPGAHQ